MTQRTSRDWLLRKQGGFETRPYKSPDLCAAWLLWTPADFRFGSGFRTPPGCACATASKRPASEILINKLTGGDGRMTPDCVGPVLTAASTTPLTYSLDVGVLFASNKASELLFLSPCRHLDLDELAGR
jgi:hypothetical protein